MFDPAPEIKKGFWFFILFILWLVYLFFEPTSALIAGGFLVAATVISHKKFA